MTEIPVAADESPPGRRLRRRQLVVVAGAVVAAALLGVGLLRGGRHPDAQRKPPPLPTTTPSPTAEITTTSTAPTTATSIAHGPLLPFPTHTVVVVRRGDTAHMIDLDSGVERNLAGMSPAASIHRGDHGFVLATASGIIYSPSDGSTPTSYRDPEPHGGVVDADAELWRREASGVWLRLDGRGRPLPGVTLPDNASPVARVTNGVLVAQMGSLSVLDDSGSARDLGPGYALAARGDHAAVDRCSALRCGLVLLDVRTDGTTPLPVPVNVDLPETTFALFSPDGRWLLLRGSSHNTTPSTVTLYDVDAHAVAATLPPADALTFSPDSTLILAARGGHLEAYEPADARALPITGIDTTGAVELVTTEP